MRKILAILLVLVMAFSLAACGASGSDVTTYKVGVAIYQYNDNFMTLYREEIEAYFKTLETDTVKYDITMVDGGNDMNTQSGQIDNFITQKMDVIILNLVQTSSADVLIDKIVAADIPLVLINREPLAYDADGNTLDEAYEGILNNAKVCYVGADARQSGTYQGEIVAALENKGDMNGDGVVKYIMVQGDPENIDAQYRTEFSVKALDDAGINSECLLTQVGNWDQGKGQEITASALTQFGADLDLVFCNNDAMALGAAAAIEQAGRVVGEDILLLGVDALDEAVKRVGEGTMTGTVLNDHIGQSHKAVDVAVQLLKGEAIENYYWVDYVKVDKAYVEANG
ncbi:MAG: substrate-binding domain-containing protein [Oscillospiraceae bacterium]|nr:substrate-binding domain-containing protein [Oscillospiraceae bacterium]